MRMSIRKMCGGLILSGLFLALLQTGCEESTGLSGLSLEPATVEMTPDMKTQVFRVSNQSNTVAGSLAVPFKWSVSDPSLGVIVASSGTTATYSRNMRNGINTIIVRDQYDNEGYATVNQQASQYAITPVAATSNNTMAVGGSITISVTPVGGGDGPTAPFHWSVSREELGQIIAGQNSATITYQAAAAGENAIHVRDANRVSGTVVIKQRY